MMYMTTDRVADRARKRLAPRRLLSCGVRDERPDKGLAVIECVCGESRSSDENTIISKTNTLVTLLERVSWPARGVKGEGPEGSGRKLPNIRSIASCFMPVLIIEVEE
jgi:hypothetical protein